MRYAGRAGRARALLETDSLIVRGDVRLSVPYADVTAVVADAGWLHITFRGDKVSLELGAAAEPWAHRITHPVPLLDKLGVKAGQRVHVVDVPGQAFMDDLRARTSHVRAGLGAPDDPPADADIVFVGVESAADLERLSALKVQIKKNGAIWVVFPKGRRDFKDTDVIRGGLAAGLVDVKVARFSATHTAIKLVFRVKDR